MRGYEQAWRGFEEQFSTEYRVLVNSLIEYGLVLQNDTLLKRGEGGIRNGERYSVNINSQYGELIARQFNAVINAFCQFIPDPTTVISITYKMHKFPKFWSSKHDAKILITGLPVPHAKLLDQVCKSVQHKIKSV